MSRTPVFSFRKCVVIAALLFVAITDSAQTRNRLVQRIEDSESSVVAPAHPMARAEFDHGRVDGSMRIDRAAMVFKLAPDQQSALEKLLAEQQNPKSSNYHKWLTPEQYAARFGMSDDDLAKVASWLKLQGLTINGFSRGHTRVFFSGTAAQVEGVFHTEFHHYLVNGEMHFANAAELSVPAALSGVVLGLRGLDDFRPKPRAHTVKPNFTSHVSGNHFVSPADFATIYNLKPLYDAGLDGSGEKIAVVGQTQIHTTDIDAFRSAAGLSTKNLQLVAVNGTGFSPADEVEADLDVEWSGGVAKNATILYVYTGSNSSQNVFNALEYAIDHNLAPVVSTSYGNCEAMLGTFAQTLQQDVQRANSQGQTVTAASGDAGAADCELQSAKSATHGPAVDGPASVPEVTGIGGSEFNGDVAGTVSGTVPNTNASDTPYWSGTGTTNADNLSSAIKYIPEMAWNDTAASIATPKGGLSASGGGVSTVFAKPTWQTALTPADNHRDVPDVSLTASPSHDGSLICSQAAVTLNGSSATSCASGFRDSGGNVAPVGGTSVGSPSFAGVVAILNQATQSGGLGNINPTLYRTASSTPSAFHDITTGNNIVPCTTGSTGCPASHSIGFSAGTGYDLVTGLGSIDANVLVTSWPGFVATPTFSLGASSVSVAAPGQSGTSTITVTATNGFTGRVDLSCTPPTGSSQITCSFGTTTPITLDSTTTSATATLTVSTVAPHALAGASASLQSQSQDGFGRLAASASAVLAGVFVLGMPSRRRRRMAGPGLMLLVFFAAGLGCGGGGGSGSGSSVKTGGTGTGNYTIVVTATSGRLSKPLNVSVAVQ
jgi:subtilase family serine protease